MPRVVPGSGASIEPIFNSIYGVRDVYVTNGGSGYDPNDPPRLRITNCGTPIREAVLRAVIEGDLGEITAVEVLDPGEGYDPLRMVIDSEDDGYGADAKVFLNASGGIDYIQVTKNGDQYFDTTTAEIRGGGGSGSELVPITGLLTGLSIEQFGQNYTNDDINLVISGGGGQNATGVANVNEFGEVDQILITNQGEFFETPPLIQIIGGGGNGATAEASINLGVIDDISLLQKGGGYVNDPQVIFTRDTNLIRTARNRQSLNSVMYNLTGLLKDVTPSEQTVYVQSTAPYPGSGKLLIGREVVRYTGKTANSFTGIDRATNFRFDQKVILDNLQDDPVTGKTAYEFRVTDRVKRVVENSNNRIAIVYDWVPEERALYLVFEIDELAFIDAGRSNEKSQAIRFVCGSASSSGTGVEPHVLIEAEGQNIVAFTNPLSLILNRKFEDDDEEYTDEFGNPAFGDGIPDLVNANTDYANDTSLDGGIASSKYGIEETLGGQNTTLLQTGDQIYDGNAQPLVAAISDAGQLGDGDAHVSTASVIVEFSGASRYSASESLSGATTGVTATFVSVAENTPKANQQTVQIKTIVNNGATYLFQVGETLNGVTSGVTATIKAIEYNSFVRNEDD